MYPHFPVPVHWGLIFCWFNSHASINFVYVIKIIIVLTDNFFYAYTCKMESNFNVLFVICSIQCVFLQRKVTCTTCSRIYIIKSWNIYILREIIQTTLYNIVQNIQFFCLTYMYFDFTWMSLPHSVHLLILHSLNVTYICYTCPLFFVVFVVKLKLTQSSLWT